MRQILTVLALSLSITAVQAQKIYNEGSVIYNVVVSTGSTEAKAADLLDGATQKVFYKGQQTRTELKSILGTGITLHDLRNGSAVVMNEYGDDNKVLIRMSKTEYEDANRKYNGIKFELKTDTKTILGYKCNLAIATLNDGSTFKVYYTTEFAFQSKDYGPQFTGLPGVPLEYEAELGKMKVTYIAGKVSFDAVTAALFDIPKSGYREMTYEEVKKLQGKN
ncbi:MAG: GLPGLI family protein [Chitinophagaceae bacterium]|nr:GLPGLI family protein [Chitinophagaceae bacterium]